MTNICIIDARAMLYSRRNPASRTRTPQLALSDVRLFPSCASTGEYEAVELRDNGPTAIFRRCRQKSGREIKGLDN